MFVGVASITNGANLSQYGTTSMITGIIMVILSLFAQGFQYITEEHILHNYHMDPKRCVGLEGYFGLVWIFVVIFIATYIPCPSELMCDMYSTMEDPISGFQQLFGSTEIIVWTIIILAAIVFINLNVMILTQHVSCVFSSFMNATRCITVWVVSVLLGMESCQPLSTTLQVIGFAFLLLGNLIYNEVLVIRFWG